jgi:F-type H+-transporting ATPase subunit c
MNIPLDPTSLAHMLQVVMAVLSIVLGCTTAAFAQGKVITATMESMARQPELSGELRFTMIIGLAMIESLAIYCLLVSLVLLFVRW